MSVDCDDSELVTLGGCTGRLTCWTICCTVISFLNLAKTHLMQEAHIYLGSAPLFN